MPCSSSDGMGEARLNEYDVRRIIGDSVQTLAAPIRAQFEPLLCSACRALERLDYDFDENPALSVWWSAHQAEDATKAEKARVEESRKAWRTSKVQEAAAKPVNQLTDEEKRLLREEGYLS